MSKNMQHGRQGSGAESAMCAHRSLEVESIGRFGRLFRGLPPLYTDPSDLVKLGAKGGPLDGGINPPKATTVPLGIVFLGQFIDHDITLDTTSSLSKVNDPAEVENFRSPNLDLDSVFGEGPEDEPFLYVQKGVDNSLLTGSTNFNHGQGQSLNEHDLARTATGAAIIGDPRNDENRIISQLHLAFIRFYNALYAEAASLRPNAPAHELHESARTATIWHYQWCIVNEFLPLIAGTEIVDKILSEGRKYYRPSGRPYLPVEFSVAAFRFGHSMISQKISLQPGRPALHLFSQEVGFGFSPITSAAQVVEWEAFFQIDGQAQKASKLDTKLVTSLLDLPFIPSPNPADRSLASRNLLRGQSFLLPSGESVARYMGRPEAEIAEVSSFVEDNTQAHGIHLKRGTPLWYYLLAEAQVVGRQDADGFKPGEGLGPIGATIVAEVLIGLLELDPNSFLGKNRNWQPSAGSSPGAFSMSDLVSKAAQLVA